MAKTTPRPFDRQLLVAYVEARLSEDLLPKNQEARQEALLAIAEVEYRLHGPSKCSICGAPVRATMHTVGMDAEGHVFNYACLCRRCLEAEKAFCMKVTSYVAGLVFDEFVNRNEPVARTSTSRLSSAA